MEGRDGGPVGVIWVSRNSFPAAVLRRETG
jgi:hypothetical protein